MKVLNSIKTNVSKSVNMGGVTLLSNQPNLDCLLKRTRLSLVLLCGAKYED